MSEKIYVRSLLEKKPDGGFPLAIFERNPEHPQGEIYVADDKVHEVAETSEVTMAIQQKRLEKLSAAEAEKLQKATEATPDTRINTVDGTADNKDKPVLELKPDDTVKSLKARYTKPLLLDLAEQLGTEVDAEATMDVIAQAIIDDNE